MGRAGTNFGFTLVELLVVIGIISILASLLLPVLAESKMAVRRTNELSSSKQLILGWHLYAEDHDGGVMPGYRNGYNAYDLKGNLIETLINNEIRSAGSYDYTFDGSHLASGIYLYELKVGENRINKKMLLIK